MHGSIYTKVYLILKIPHLILMTLEHYTYKSYEWVTDEQRTDSYVTSVTATWISFWQSRVLHSICLDNRKERAKRVVFRDDVGGSCGFKACTTFPAVSQGHLYRFARWGVSHRYGTTQQLSLAAAPVTGTNFYCTQDSLSVGGDDLSLVLSGTLLMALQFRVWRA
jgi:hypothetical protein